MGPQEQFIDIEGIKFAYFQKGNRDSRLIITLHGGRGFGKKDSDFSVYSQLSSDFNIVSFDFRGHGNSSFIGPFTFAQLVQDIESIRYHFAKHEPCIIIGGSFGGFLAQQYAITFPNNISHLILRGTGPSYHHEQEAKEVLQSRLHLASNASMQMLEKVFSSFESDQEMRLVMFALAPLYSESYDADKGLVSVLNTKYYSKSHNELYSEAEKYFDYRDQLPSIIIPTLIIVGEKDWICPVTQSILMSQLIPNSELQVISGSNHSVHLEKPDIVLEKIKGFLNK